MSDLEAAAAYVNRVLPDNPPSLDECQLIIYAAYLDGVKAQRETCAKLVEQEGRGENHDTYCCCAECERAEPSNLAAAIRAQGTAK